MTKQQFKNLYLQCLDEAVAAAPEDYVGDWRKEPEEKRQEWAEKVVTLLPSHGVALSDSDGLKRMAKKLGIKATYKAFGELIKSLEEGDAPAQRLWLTTSVPPAHGGPGYPERTAGTGFFVNDTHVVWAPDSTSPSRSRWLNKGCVTTEEPAPLPDKLSLRRQWGPLPATDRES